MGLLQSPLTNDKLFMLPYSRHYHSVKGVPVCSISQMVRCYIPVNHIARKKSQPCIDGCPLHCKQHEFDISREISNLPRSRYQKMKDHLGGNDSQVEDYIQVNRVFLFPPRFKGQK